MIKFLYKERCFIYFFNVVRKRSFSMKISIIFLLLLRVSIMFHPIAAISSMVLTTSKRDCDTLYYDSPSVIELSPKKRAQISPKETYLLGLPENPCIRNISSYLFNPEDLKGSFRDLHNLGATCKDLRGTVICRDVLNIIGKGLCSEENLNLTLDLSDRDSDLVKERKKLVCNAFSSIEVNKINEKINSSSNPEALWLLFFEYYKKFSEQSKVISLYWESELPKDTWFFLVQKKIYLISISTLMQAKYWSSLKITNKIPYENLEKKMEERLEGFTENADFTLYSPENLIDLGFYYFESVGNCKLTAKSFYLNKMVNFLGKNSERFNFADLSRLHRWEVAFRKGVLEGIGKKLENQSEEERYRNIKGLTALWWPNERKDSPVSELFEDILKILESSPILKYLHPIFSEEAGEDAS